jgi:glycosyltransferase involved in cell wall biosynthesis
MVKVSVIIPTKNEEKNIVNCIESIVGQNYERREIEIIVVDNGSTDRTVDLAKRYADKIYEYGSERSESRNYGVKKASGKYVLFVDADMRLGRKVIEECVRRIESNSEAVALYIPEIMVGDSFGSKVRRFERGFYNGTVIDAVRFISKAAFEKVGGYDEKMYACEDWDLDKRLKKYGSFVIIKSPLYHNESKFDWGRYFKKKFYYAENINKYEKKWGYDDPDVNKQLRVWYRAVGVFVEDGKWKKLLARPHLALAMYLMRFITWVDYVISSWKSGLFV